MILRFCLLCALVAIPASAQEGGVSLEAPQQEAGLPVEVTAESLSLDQAGGVATFSGDVVVSQGEMRLSAPDVIVTYAETGEGERRITTVEATGGVTLAAGEQAAEAREALYTVDESRVVMTGEVVLTQGENVLSGERLVLDLAAGTGRVEGDVRTIFQSGGP